jgi:hypothetical protein
MADTTEAAPTGPPDTTGLPERFGGDLLRPGDVGYEDARRVWNGSIDRLPVLIARCGVGE